MKAPTNWQRVKAKDRMGWMNLLQRELMGGGPRKHCVWPDEWNPHSSWLPVGHCQIGVF